MAIPIITGQDKTLVVRLQNGITGDPYDLSLADYIEVCFTKNDGTFLEKWLLTGVTGDTAVASNIISNISDTSTIKVGMPVSGVGIPAGSTVVQTPTSVPASAPGTIQISANATALGTAIALIFGDITIVTPAVLGKIRVELSESETNSLEVGDSESFEVKVRVSGVVSIVQFLAALQVIQALC